MNIGIIPIMNLPKIALSCFNMNVLVTVVKIIPGLFCDIVKWKSCQLRMFAPSTEDLCSLCH